ncbi:MAG: hypothetical protein HDS75_00180 [Bacteroidales bacterium]|nr:hypothetical protein [Bacteroidales bacterium]
MADLYIRERTCPCQDNGMGEVFLRSSRNYQLFKLLKHRLADEYDRVTHFNEGFSGIEYAYSDARIILLNEYFLWLNNNDIPELEALLTKYGVCIASMLYDSKDIFTFEYDNDPYNKVNSGNIDDNTKAFVEKLLRPLINHRLRQLRNQQNPGIYNNLTGEVVRPSGGTYYINDFR